MLGTKTRVPAKFSSFTIHKWRKPLEAIAQKLTPVIRGVLNYYGKLDDTYVEGLVSIKPAIIGVGTMGERSIQKRSHQMFATKV